MENDSEQYGDDVFDYCFFLKINVEWISKKMDFVRYTGNEISWVIKTKIYPWILKIYRTV